MSTPDQPMTRRQMRELAKTGALPVQGADDTTPSEPAPVEESPVETSAEEVVFEVVEVVEPAVESAESPDTDTDTEMDAPELSEEVFTDDGAVDLEAVPLTRRQARDQERIRTASVPLISSEDADAHAANVAAAEHNDEVDVVEADVVVAGELAEASVEESDAPEESVGSEDRAESDAPVEPEEPVVVGPQFGASLLAGEPEVEAIELPASFDELIARNASSASVATPSALILSQAPEAPSLSGPIAATGEIILTGSYRLPDGLGSAGADPRSTDDKQTDAVLIDGELPPSSSPTPIAASAAVSTIRGADEVIRPPAPEKGNRLVLALAITAGVLMIAVIGVLVAVVASGALS